MKIKRDEGMGNIALTILSIITARPEREEEGCAQCDINESQKRGRGDRKMVEKYLIHNIALTMLILTARPEGEGEGRCTV